jgi:hypothetical protein
VLVTNNGRVKKRFPQGGGGGGQLILGEETEKRDVKKGPGTEGTGTRIVRVGDWTVVIWASHLRLLLLCAASGNYLQAPFDFAQGRLCGAASRRLRAIRFVVSHPFRKEREKDGARYFMVS